MEKYKVAIVVPVYNVEKYVKECLLSIKEQTYKNFITIVVNDGTQDNSVSIIEETIKDDARFILLHKENGGLASARNYGLKYIKDNNLDIDYIAYVDSDDLITEDFVEVFVQNMSEHNADVAFCFYKELYKSGVNIVSNDIQDGVLSFNQDKIISIYVGDKKLPKEYKVANALFLCNKVFNYKKLKHIPFNEKKGIIGEDINYLLDVLSITDKAIIIPKNLSIYRKRASSLSHTNKKNRYEQHLSMLLDVYKKYENRSICNYINKELIKKFFRACFYYLDLNKKQEAYDFWNKYISIIREIKLDDNVKLNVKKKKFLTKLSFTTNCFYNSLHKRIHKKSKTQINHEDFFD